MKIILRSACLLLIIFLFFIAGFSPLVSASDDPYLFNKNNYTGKWGNLYSPASEYKFWGYNDTTYNFVTELENNSIVHKSLNDTTMVFYWNCLSDNSSYDPFPMNNETHRQNKNGQEYWNCSHKWNRTGTYYLSVAMYQNKSVANVSFWVPIRIINDTTIKVQSFCMVDEDKKPNYNSSSFDCSSSNLKNYTVPGDSDKWIYCAYAEKTHYFSAELNATLTETNGTLADSNLTFQRHADERAVNETTTEVNWSDGYDYNSYNKLIDISDRNKSYQWSEEFTHRWNEPGEKKITVKNYHWDPLSGNPRDSNDTNVSILIIKDPKNFISYTGPFSLISFLIEPFSNLQNLGIFLVTVGLMILFFTFTKNNVPIKISLFGVKPFYLKSVDSFIGIFTFVTGIYLYYIFGRCPWDIPIISSLPGLPDAYFDMLYYEYHIIPNHIIPIPIYKTDVNAFPCLSILLGLIVVSTSSMIVYRIGTPYLKGEKKSWEFLRVKGIPMLRSNISWLSVRFKEFSNQIKEYAGRIYRNGGKGNRLKRESGKSEKMR